jgi:Raf kinase inhibitor-like YbhB/YbcL family protein
MRYGLPLVTAALLLAGPALAREPSRIEVRSPAFTAGGAIPPDFTCEEKGNMPPLEWNRVPDGTRSVAVTIDDPDAPRGDFVHLIAYNLVPDARQLPKAAVLGGGGDVGAFGVNSDGQTGYAPLCPPSGTHRYRFRVYALDTQLALTRPTMPELERAMRGHVIGRGELVATFAK